MPSVLALVLVASGCFGGKGEPAEGGEAATKLQEIARLSDPLEFKVVYRYEQRGPLRESAETRLEIVQRPPESLRKFETTTAGADETYTETSWYASKRSDPADPTSELVFYTCYSGDFTTKGEVRCLEALPTGMFGRRQIDEVFDLVRDPQESFEEVRQMESATIAGEDATCFEARHRSGAPAPTASPQLFDPRSHRLQLCYSSDGILLRLHREIDEPIPTGQGELTSVMEATSVSRTVRAADLRLPGPVADPDAPTPTPAA
jgi:hypothetical protein